MEEDTRMSRGDWYFIGAFLAALSVAFMLMFSALQDRKPLVHLSPEMTELKKEFPYRAGETVRHDR